MNNKKYIWIIEADYSYQKNFHKLIRLLKKTFNKNNVEVDIISTYDIITYFDNKSKPRLHINKKIKSKEPDFIVFWNKEILIAKHFEKMGYKVFNNAQSIDICDNKNKTTLELNNVLIPKTINSRLYNLNSDKSEKLLEYYESIIPYPMVYKTSKGSSGLNVFLVNNKEELKEKIKEFNYHPFILQEVINTSIGVDLRVVFVGRKIIVTIKRENKESFVANLSFGGTGSIYKLSKNQKKQIKNMIKSFDLHWGGLDVLFKDDKLIFCEMNSNMEFYTYKERFNISIAEYIVEYLLKIDKKKGKHI